MRNWINDFAFAWSTLFKRRLFAVVSLLTLGICIGGNTFVFTITDSFVLKPLPYPESDQLVELYNSFPGYQYHRAASSLINYKEFSEQASAFEDLTFINKITVNVEQGEVPFSVRAQRVPPEFFRILRVKPFLGRVIDERDFHGMGTSDNTVVVAYSVWNKVFKGDENAIGKSMKIDGQLFTLVGVMPKGFYYEEMDARIWSPFFFPEYAFGEDFRHHTMVNMFGRLKKGYTVAEANKQLDEINRKNYDKIATAGNRDSYDIGGFHTVVWPLKNRMSESYQSNLFLLQGGVLVMLIIGCVNVANLLMIRSNDRMGEFAIRSAIGASKKKILRLVLCESILISFLGGIIGLIFGVSAILIFDSLVSLRSIFSMELSIDFAVIGFTLLIAVVAGAICGGFSLLNVWRRNHNEVLKEDTRTGSTSGFVGAMTSILVVFQVALTFALTYSAGLLYMSFYNMMDADIGFEPSGVYNAKIDLPYQRYTEAPQMVSVIRKLSDAISAVPGIESAALAKGGPFNPGGITLEQFKFQDRMDKNAVSRILFTTDDLFETLDIDLVSGRLFRPTDTPESGIVNIIDTFTADKYWPNEDPVGKKISFIGGGFVQDSDGWATIIGVVDHVKIRELDMINQREKGITYFYYKQQPYRQIYIHVKTKLSYESLQRGLREAVMKVDPELPVYDLQTQQGRIDFLLFKRRVFMMTFVACSCLAILLSVVGIFGLVAYSCSLRTKEIGIRRAIGAKRGQVSKLMLSIGIKRITIGLGIGFVVIYLFAGFLEEYLFEMSTIEPLMLIGTSVAVLIVGILATLIPSEAASRTSPVVALNAS